MGGIRSQGVEIWDIKQQASIRILKVEEGSMTSLASTSNILAVGSGRKKLFLWDVRSWEMFHSLETVTQPQSLHLTTDAKFLTIGGYGGDLCIVLSIK